MNSKDFNVHTECERAGILLDALLRAEAMDFDRIRDLGCMTLQYQETATKRMQALRAAKAVLREFMEYGIDTTQAQDIKEWLIANRYFGASSDEDAEPEDHTGEVYRVYYQIKRERTPRFADFPEDSEADTYTEEQLIADILFDHSEHLPLSVKPEQVKIISREWLSQHEADHEFER